MERGVDDRQAAGREQRTADTLDHARSDQQLHVRGHCTQQGCSGEPDDSQLEDAPPSVAIAERAAEQDQ
jgi:hypothetical protein